MQKQQEEQEEKKKEPEVSNSGDIPSLNLFSCLDNFSRPTTLSNIALIQPEKLIDIPREEVFKRLRQRGPYNYNIFIKFFTLTLIRFYR